MAGEFKPRGDTLQWAAAAMVGCVVIAIATHDPMYLFPGTMLFALMLQCRQRLVVDGGFAQRYGLRPAVVELATAEVVQSGSSWWRELFFCGPVLQLRDADGQRLYLEAWLWDEDTRRALVEAVTVRSGS